MEVLENSIVGNQRRVLISTIITKSDVSKTLPTIYQQYNGRVYQQITPREHE